MVESEDRSDLTRLESPQDIALKHYLDCALPLKFVKLPSPLLDIGTGAGFPGLVLKILSPETQVILGENRPKRVKFLEACISALELKGIEVFAHRIGPQFPLAIQGVVTRALESARDTLYRVQPFLPQGGQVILLKGPKGDEEIAEAIHDVPDFAHEKTYRYNLGNSANERRLVVFTRLRESVRSVKDARAEKPERQGLAVAGAMRPPRTLEITSRANPQFKALLALGEAKAIRKEKRFLLSGERLVAEVLASEGLRQNLLMLLTAPGLSEIKTAAETILLSAQLFREIDFSGTRTPIAVMRTPEILPWSPALRGGITVFLPFQDPGNIGAAIRTAAAFGAQRVVLLKEAASPFLPKSVRAAANALFHIELFSGPSLDELIASGEKFYRLDAVGEDIARISFGDDVWLLPGIEGYGFRTTGNTVAVKIPIAGAIESLNAQSALSIALYEIARRRGQA